MVDLIELVEVEGTGLLVAPDPAAALVLATQGITPRTRSATKQLHLVLSDVGVYGTGLLIPITRQVQSVDVLRAIELVRTDAEINDFEGRTFKWWLADLMYYMDRRWSSTRLALAEALGRSTGYLYNLAWIGGGVPIDVRRLELPFWTHAPVARDDMPIELKRRWLDLAQQNHWSRPELEAEIERESLRGQGRDPMVVATSAAISDAIATVPVGLAGMPEVLAALQTAKAQVVEINHRPHDNTSNSGEESSETTTTRDAVTEAAERATTRAGRAIARMDGPDAWATATMWVVSMVLAHAGPSAEERLAYLGRLINLLGVAREDDDG